MQDLTLTALLAGYRSGALTVRGVVAAALDSIAACEDQAIWIRILTSGELEPYLQHLESVSPDSLPLYGVPFAIKDNIDLAGIPTTAGCPAYAFTPETSATVVARLIAAGALPLGKTNLDQFATGLVGVRTPYGIPVNPFDPDYIPGGSSCGSACAVSRGQVTFSLGTDTAGSGRVPASFQNLIGLKPTRGALSTRGVVPACRTLDCVSIFALTAGDAATAFSAAAAFDPDDSWSRPLPAALPRPLVPGCTLGIPRPDQLEFFGDTGAAALFQQSLETARQCGATLVEVDLAPFLDAARLLYEGPWVAERWLTARALLAENPDTLLPVTRQIISGGATPTAAEAFAATYRLADLRRIADAVWSTVDAILTPTAGTIYRQDEVTADPVRLNSNLGRYTNFMNLLDLAAVAVPAGFLPNGLPWGITVFAPAGSDCALLDFAARWQHATALPPGRHQMTVAADAPHPPPGVAALEIAVCGAHMSGLPLNHQLTSRGGWFVRNAQTSAGYRFYSLPGGPPFRPGLIRSESGGACIDLEIWALPLPSVGSFLAGIPSPLGLGTVFLADGTTVCGFVCESIASAGATEITHIGNWRTFLASNH